jgi:hypothetical protein
MVMAGQSRQAGRDRCTSCNWTDSRWLPTLALLDSGAADDNFISAACMLQAAWYLHTTATNSDRATFVTLLSQVGVQGFTEYKISQGTKAPTRSQQEAQSLLAGDHPPEE